MGLYWIDFETWSRGCSFGNATSMKDYQYVWNFMTKLRKMVFFWKIISFHQICLLRSSFSPLLFGWLDCRWKLWISCNGLLGSVTLTTNTTHLGWAVVSVCGFCVWFKRAMEWQCVKLWCELARVVADGWWLWWAYSIVRRLRLLISQK